MDICQSVLATFFVRAAAGQYDLDRPEGLRELLVAIAKNKLGGQIRRHRAQRRDARKGVALDGIDATRAAPVRPLRTAGRAGVARARSRPPRSR